ncbi:PPW family C-terminal domain-containing PPE protein [Mycobacterium kiyosense]
MRLAATPTVKDSRLHSGPEPPPPSVRRRRRQRPHRCPAPPRPEPSAEHGCASTATNISSPTSTKRSTDRPTCPSPTTSQPRPPGRGRRASSARCAEQTYQRSGLTRLPGAEFTDGPQEPMLPNTWTPGDEGR